MMGKLGDGSAQLGIANRSGGAPSKIDQNTFTKRLQALYLHWKKYKNELWGSADFYAVATPPPTEDICYLKSSTFNIWLLGYEFPDTIMVFGSKQIHLLCSQKNASLLESVKGSAKEAVDVDVVIHAKLNGEDGTSKMDVVLHSIRMSKSEADDAPIVGYIVEESPEGSLLEKWADKLKTSGLQLSDVTDGLSDLFAVKDPNELTFAKEAAYLTDSAMKNLVVPKLKRLTDEEKKVPKSSLMNYATEKAAVLDPARIKVKLIADNVEDICCPPSFQSETSTKCQILSLLLGDEVHVSNGRPDVVTNLSSQVDDVKNMSAYTFDDAEEEVEPMLNRFKPIRLYDLQMYPPFDDTGRKMTGALEAHANGFRYSTSGQDDERVDIMLANIKHAFVQPTETLKYTLLHFHLHNHMMVGNKKTKDLQFYIEVQGGDLDERDEEQIGCIKKKKMDFQNFVNWVHEGLDLEFEQPQFELGFHGQPSDRCTSAFIVPTKSCLVELTKIPFLVITLSEIAIVNLERICRHVRRPRKEEFLKTRKNQERERKRKQERERKKQQERQKEFDMAIVFKDIKRDVMVIRGIQPTSLEGINVWMKTSAGIKYHKSSLNLKWRAILDAFLDDPQVFVDVGGWDFLYIKNDCDSDYDDESYF